MSSQRSETERDNRPPTGSPLGMGTIARRAGGADRLPPQRRNERQIEGEGSLHNLADELGAKQNMDRRGFSPASSG